MSNENNALITVEDIQNRIEEIALEQKTLDDRQYQYGYIAPRMTVAKLSQEYRELTKVLEVLEGYSLEEIQKELDGRDPLAAKPQGEAKLRGARVQGPGAREGVREADDLNSAAARGRKQMDGLAKYSFEVLGHAEKVLQHQDKELQARVDLGERVISQWESTFQNLSWEEDRAVYGLIRDKDLPYERLEESIRKCLIRMNEDLQKDLCDIGGRKCLKIDEWKDGADTFVLGNAVSEGEFFYADVNGKITNCFEYDFRPSRVQVVDDWINQEAERELNRQEVLAEGFDVELEAQKGDREFYKIFYAGEQDEEAFDFREETGWNMIWGSDYQGFNGDTWVVFRKVEDLPKWMREYAQEQLEAQAHQPKLMDVLEDAVEKAGAGRRVGVEQVFEM